jgi:hypothetical protein
MRRPDPFALLLVSVILLSVTEVLRVAAGDAAARLDPRLTEFVLALAFVM